MKLINFTFITLILSFLFFEFIFTMLNDDLANIKKIFSLQNIKDEKEKDKYSKIIGAYTEFKKLYPGIDIENLGNFSLINFLGEIFLIDDKSEQKYSNNKKEIEDAFKEIIYLLKCLCIESIPLQSDSNYYIYDASKTYKLFKCIYTFYDSLISDKYKSIIDNNGFEKVIQALIQLSIIAANKIKIAVLYIDQNENNDENKYEYTLTLENYIKSQNKNSDLIVNQVQLSDKKNKSDENKSLYEDFKKSIENDIKIVEKIIEKLKEKISKLEEDKKQNKNVVENKQNENNLQNINQTIYQQVLVQKDIQKIDNSIVIKDDINSQLNEIKNLIANKRVKEIILSYNGDRFLVKSEGDNNFQIYNLSNTKIDNTFNNIIILTEDSPVIKFLGESGFLEKIKKENKTVSLFDNKLAIKDDVKNGNFDIKKNEPIINTFVNKIGSQKEEFKNIQQKSNLEVINSGVNEKNNQKLISNFKSIKPVVRHVVIPSNKKKPITNKKKPINRKSIKPVTKVIFKKNSKIRGKHIGSSRIKYAPKKKRIKRINPKITRHRIRI
jgi:hypothetical protein